MTTAKATFSGVRSTDTSCKQSDGVAHVHGMDNEVVAQKKVGSKGRMGHERQRSSTNVIKIRSENSALRGTASCTPHHAASLGMNHAGIGLLPLTCGVAGGLQ